MMKTKSGQQKQKQNKNIANLPPPYWNQTLSSMWEWVETKKNKIATVKGN